MYDKADFGGWKLEVPPGQYMFNELDTYNLNEFSFLKKNAKATCMPWDDCPKEDYLAGARRM